MNSDISLEGLSVCAANSDTCRFGFRVHTALACRILCIVLSIFNSEDHKIVVVCKTVKISFKLQLVDR